MGEVDLGMGIGAVSPPHYRAEHGQGSYRALRRPMIVSDWERSFVAAFALNSAYLIIRM